MTPRPPWTPPRLVALGPASGAAADTLRTTVPSAASAALTPVPMS